jgi:hypothetical protein
VRIYPEPVIGKEFVKFVEPKKQTHHSYTSRCSSVVLILKEVLLFILKHVVNIRPLGVVPDGPNLTEISPPSKHISRLISDI